MPYNITKRFTFYGLLPYNSDQLHLAIVLNSKDGLVKYCYCTSKYKNLLSGIDSIEIAGTRMAPYFKEVKDTYIYISEHHIIDILLVTLVSRLDNEYDVMEPISADIYEAIVSKIGNSDNLSERFKQELLAFLA
jgi:hypothetical protein